MFAILYFMKYLHKLPIQLVITVFIGFVAASMSTSISYACKPIDGAKGCVAYDKALMHISDLFANKQDSLTHFIATFLVVGCVTFVLLRVTTLLQRKKTA